MGEKMIEGEEQNKLSVWFCDDLDNVSLRTFHKSNEAIQLSCLVWNIKDIETFIIIVL